MCINRAAVTLSDSLHSLAYTLKLFLTLCHKDNRYSNEEKALVILTDIKHAESEFTAENGADYTAALLHTVEQISPEIYENYRELLHNFRGAVKRMLEQYYDAKTKTFAMDETSEKVFCGAVQKACGEYLLLAEKYQECMR